MGICSLPRHVCLRILLVCLFLAPVTFSDASGISAAGVGPLSRAKIFLAAGDYGRAVSACKENLEQHPSVEAYVYLTYVYHAMDGYVEWLTTKDDWGKVGQLALSLVDRGTMDLVDPPDMLTRMAKELLQEGLRQQFDITAGMANRLDKARVDEMWKEQAAWGLAHPDDWWAGIPPHWKW